MKKKRLGVGTHFVNGNGSPATTHLQVWIFPGSVFGSERWLEQLLQQHSAESANGTCSRVSKKDLMAVIEGNFFMRPYSHPVNITDGFFQSFQVSRDEH